MSETKELMLTSLSKEAESFYSKGDLNSLINLLASTSAMIAIMINIKMTKTNPNYTEESGTLQYTLLPFLNEVVDYSFIADD